MRVYSRLSVTLAMNAESLRLFMARELNIEWPEQVQGRGLEQARWMLYALQNSLENLRVCDEREGGERRRGPGN